MFTKKWISNSPKYLQENGWKHIFKIIFCWLKYTLAGMFEVSNHIPTPTLQFKERKYKLWIGRPPPLPHIEHIRESFKVFSRKKIWIYYGTPSLEQSDKLFLTLNFQSQQKRRRVLVMEFHN